MRVVEVMMMGMVIYEGMLWWIFWCLCQVSMRRVVFSR